MHTVKVTESYDYDSAKSKHVSEKAKLKLTVTVNCNLEAPISIYFISGSLENSDLIWLNHTQTELYILEGIQ